MAEGNNTLPGAGPSPVLGAALAWHGAGYCVLPVTHDGQKRPDLSSWTPYITMRPTRDQVIAWFRSGRTGLGLVCGKVSGGLEMLELEGRAVAAGKLAELRDLADAAGLGDLLRCATLGGYAEQTPSGGLHFLYRVDGPVPGNTKLAQTADQLTLAETRGEGGFVVIAPSHGAVHETGRPWQAQDGCGPSTVPVLTVEERDALTGLFRALDETPAPDPLPSLPARATVAGPAPDGARPGDDFEQRTDWTDILGPHGWTLVHRRGPVRYWRRPGKKLGVSATTGRAEDRDRLFVFSTSTPFAAEQPYTKFAAHAVLDHGGDHSAAARALAAAGYGRVVPRQRMPVDDGMPSPNGNRPVSAMADKIHTTEVAEPSPATFGPSEDGLARAFVAAHGATVRYCPQRRGWLTWTGHRWAWDDADRHRELIRDLARALPDAEGWRAFRQRALSAGGVTGVARLAQSDPAVVVHLGELDADPYALNTPTGVVDLRTGRLSPPDPAGMHTRSTACAADPDADPAVWRRFLADTFDGDGELIGYLARLVGYSAVGAVGPHVLPFAYGTGGNGKGAFLGGVTKVLGDYATTAPLEFLMAQRYTSHETDIARLAGARMVLCSEVNDGDRFDEARVKLLTGGDTLTARFMRQDHFTFTPTHQLWLLGNHQPAVRAGGRAFWRRLRLIPFDQEVPDAKMIDDLQGILARDHGSTLLSWIITGAVAYHRDGLRDPERVKAATAAYEHDQDTVGRFVEECCLIGGGEHVKTPVGTVRTAYQTWCEEAGEAPVSDKALTTRLHTRFAVASKQGAKGKRFYFNLHLLDADSGVGGPGKQPDREWFR